MTKSDTDYNTRIEIILVTFLSLFSLKEYSIVGKKSNTSFTYAGYSAGVEQCLGPQLASLTAVQTLNSITQLVLQLGQDMHWHMLW